MAASVVERIVTISELPFWWPPVGSHEITEAEVRELFSHLRTVTRPVMTDARRRIRERVGNDPIRVDYVTVERLAGKRLGTIDVVTLIWLSARTGARSKTSRSRCHRQRAYSRRPRR